MAWVPTGRWLIVHVALTGPCHPQDLADVMTPTDAAKALKSPGDRGIPVSELARNLLAAGHRVTVATLCYRPGIEQAEFRGPGFQLVQFPGRTRARHHLRDIYRSERSQLSRFLRDARPDLVHAHWTYEYELAAQDSRLRHVTTAHDSPMTVLRYQHDAYRAARMAIAAIARRRIEVLSAVSPNLAQRWRTQMAYRSDIKVIPNSVPVGFRSLPRHPDEVPTVLDVADHGPLKNIRGLLRAFALVRRELPTARLRLVGPGLEASGGPARWARQEQLDAGVAFLGPLGRAEVSQEYSRAWLLAHASREESFGLSVLEALASGLPVVAGRSAGGIPYVLDNGRAGWLTDVTDGRTFAAAMLAALAGGPRSPLPGAAKAVATFSAHRVTAEYEGWYRTAVDGKGPTSDDGGPEPQPATGE